jgi:phosphomannomutase
MIEKIFKAYDIRATYPRPLSEDAAWKVGHATAQYLKRSRQNLPPEQRVKYENALAVGRDMRTHSGALAAALIEGVRSTGMDVVDLGMVDTALLYFAVNRIACVGGVQVTASHNAANYNGFKIAGPQARPIGAATGLDDIRRITLGLRTGKTGVQGKLVSLDVWADYRKHVLRFLELRRKLRVVVDAANGMAGKMVPAVFSGIEQLEIIPLLFDATGAFAHEPDPHVRRNLAMLQDRVRAEQADCGIAFDGDADRCALVDEQGEPISGDFLTALLASSFLAQPQNRGATIIYDVRCSRVVPEVIAAAGGIPHRDRVGHSFIRRTMADTGAIFAGELSGHYYFRDNFGCDSAAIAMARVLSVIAQQSAPLSELVKPLKKCCQSGELNFEVEDKDAKMRELAEMYKKQKLDYFDGLTVELENCWFNIRKSNTEPLLRLNVEAATPELLAAKLGELRSLLGDPIE